MTLRRVARLRCQGRDHHRQAAATDSNEITDLNTHTEPSTEHQTSAAASAAGMFSYDDDVVRKFAIATIIWAVVTALAGLLIGTLMIAPQISAGRPWLAYGRMRPVHTNIAVFGFLANAVFTFVYFSTQRLCRREMFSAGMSRLHFWSWQLIVSIAMVLTPLGITQSKEYAEWEWPIDLALIVSWIGLFAINYILTIANRRQTVAYISLWFYGASILVVGLVYTLNSMAVPAAGWTSLPLTAGVSDAALQWFYGHNLISFLMTIPFMGALYYFLPKAADRPLHSYPLAVLHFWSLVMLTLWAGPHHLHLTAIPDWTSSLGMLFGIAILMPSVAGVVNGWRTLMSAGGRAWSDPVLRFFAAAIVCYAIVVALGTLQSIKSLNALTHYTDWVIAYAHTATMGWNGLVLIAVLYWLMPRLFQTKLHSEFAAKLHFWLAVIGIATHVIPLYVAGVYESKAWMRLSDVGELRHGEWSTMLQWVKPLWHARLIGGILYASGWLIMTWNLALTWSARPAVYQVPEYSTHVDSDRPSIGQSVGGADRDPTIPRRGKLDDAPVLNAARRFQHVSSLRWHQRYEQLPRRIMLPIIVMVGLAGCLEIVPLIFINRSTRTAIANGTIDAAVQAPYSELEWLGRDIYRREGCVNCHSQTVRPLVAEAKRYGQPSVAADFASDRPFLWGSRRVGPDLAREGDRQSSLWHWQHLIDPRAVNPDSVMPAFEQLSWRPLNFERMDALVRTSDLLQEVAMKNTADDRDELAGEIEDGETIDGEAIDSESDGVASIRTGDSDVAAANEPADPPLMLPSGDHLRAKLQAETIAADIVSQGGPLSTAGLMTYDCEAVALIAYLQRLGVAPAAPPPPPAAEPSILVTP